MKQIEPSLPDVSFDSILSQSHEVLHQAVGDETVLLDLASERYFGLNPVGARIWQLLDGSAALADIHRILCTEFAADNELIGNDLLALANKLAEEGLVSVR